jgi:hypothetical protein
MQELMYNVVFGATNHSLNILLGCYDFPFTDLLADAMTNLIQSYLSAASQKSIDLLNHCPLLANNSSSTPAIFLNSSHDAMNNLSQAYFIAASQQSLNYMYPA